MLYQHRVIKLVTLFIWKGSNMAFEVGNSGQTGSTIIDSTFRPGMIAMTGGAAPPSGFLMCDGDEYDPLTYPALFAQIGTNYNTGGETPGFFRVPAFQARVPVGVGTIGGQVWARGTQFGDENLQAHTHTVTDPGHNHTQNAHTHTQDAHTHTQDAHTHTQNAHNHNQTGSTVTVGDPGGGQITNITVGGGWYITVRNTSTDVVGNQNTTATNQNTTATNQNTTATNNSNTTGITNQNATATNNSNTTGLTVDSSGSGAAGNIQPGLGVNFIIKY